MEKATITKLNKTFEESAYEQDGIEYWLARELQLLLGYTDWRNFINAIDKAKETCKTTSEAVSDHFVDITKMVSIGSGAEPKQGDIMLKNNTDIRILLGKSGIKPEHLPAEEDIKKLERRVKASDKAIGRNKPNRPAND